MIDTNGSFTLLETAGFEPVGEKLVVVLCVIRGLGDFCELQVVSPSSLHTRRR